MTTGTRALFALTVFAATIVAAAAPAAGQSEAELRRENQRLRAELRDSQAELAAARQTIESLTAELERLQAELAAARSGSRGRSPSPDRKPEPVSIDESKPDASPRALLRALKERYADRFADADRGQPDSRERTMHLRDINRWAATVARELRSRVSWTVRVREVTPRGTSAELRVEAVDPKTGTVLGDPFTIVAADRLARRLQGLDLSASDDTLVVEGVLTPDVIVDPNREEPGPFNRPPLIGPFVAFDFTLQPHAFDLPKPESDAPSEEDAPAPESERTRGGRR